MPGTAIRSTSARRIGRVAAPAAERPSVAEVSKFLGSGATRQSGDCALLAPDGTKVALPESVRLVLGRAAEYLARGDSVTVIPSARDLTTQEAADLLGFSRQYLVRLLDEGRLACRRTGRHRRIALADVLAFKERRDRRRRAKLDALARLSRETADGYSELR